MRVEKIEVWHVLSRQMYRHCPGTWASAADSRLESHADVETALIDPELLLRACNNLLLNAIQAAPERSFVSNSRRRNATTNWS